MFMTTSAVSISTSSTECEDVGHVAMVKTGGKVLGVNTSAGHQQHVKPQPRLEPCPFPQVVVVAAYDADAFCFLL